MAGRRLEKLNTQHRAAARLRVEGRTIEQIRQELGVATRTLHVWFSDPLIKAEVARLLERVEDVFVERKATIGLRALDELAEYAAMPAGRVRRRCECRTCGHVGDTTAPHGTADPKCDGPWDVYEVEYVGESTKLDALREILDRVDHTTKLRDRAEAQKAANGGGDVPFQNILQVFQGASDAQVAELVRGLAGSQNGNSPDGHPPALPA